MYILLISLDLPQLPKWILPKQHFKAVPTLRQQPSGLSQLRLFDSLSQLRPGLLFGHSWLHMQKLQRDWLPNLRGLLPQHLQFVQFRILSQHSGECLHRLQPSCLSLVLRSCLMPAL
jgi:hypothetical protein